MKKISERKLKFIAIYYYFNNPMLLLISFFGILVFFLSIGFWVNNQDMWTIGFVISFYYPIYKYIITKRLLRNAKDYRNDRITINSPCASLHYIKTKSGKNCLGLKIKGVSDSKKVTFIQYEPFGNVAKLKRIASDINNHDQYSFLVIEKTKIIANYFGDSKIVSNVVKLSQKIYYTNINSKKLKRARYPYIEFNLSKIIENMNTSDLIDEYYLVNEDNQYILVKMLPNVDNLARSFFIDSVEFDDINQVIETINKGQFIINNNVRIFEIEEGNSPILLMNRLNDDECGY